MQLAAIHQIKSKREIHLQRPRPDYRKSYWQLQAQLQTMATENPSVYSVKTMNQKKKLLKRRLEKIVADVAIEMTKANAQLNERSVPNVKSWTILPEFYL